MPGCNESPSGNKGSIPEDGKPGYGRHQPRRGKQQKLTLYGWRSCRHSHRCGPATASSQWCLPSRITLSTTRSGSSPSKTRPYQPARCMAADLLAAPGKSLCNRSQPAAAGQPGGWAWANTCRNPQTWAAAKARPCACREGAPAPLGKWGGVFSCFASSSPVAHGSRPCCACLSGLNVIRQGQNLQVSLSLGYNGSVEKSSAPAGCNTAPREGGQPGSAVGTQAPAAQHLPPFGTSGHCCFPLTSCLRSPDRKQNG